MWELMRLYDWRIITLHPVPSATRFSLMLTAILRAVRLQVDRHIVNLYGNSSRFLVNLGLLVILSRFLMNLDPHLMDSCRNPDVEEDTKEDELAQVVILMEIRICQATCD